MVRQAFAAYGYDVRPGMTIPIDDDKRRRFLDEFQRKLERWEKVNKTDRTLVIVYYQGHGTHSAKASDGLILANKYAVLPSERL